VAPEPTWTLLEAIKFPRPWFELCFVQSVDCCIVINSNCRTTDVYCSVSFGDGEPSQLFVTLESLLQPAILLLQHCVMKWLERCAPTVCPTSCGILLPCAVRNRASETVGTFHCHTTVVLAMLNCEHIIA